MTFELTKDADCHLLHDHIGEFVRRDGWADFRGATHKVESKINDRYITHCGRLLKMKPKGSKNPLTFTTAALTTMCQDCTP